MSKKVNKELYFPFNAKGLMDYSDLNYPSVATTNQCSWYPTEWRKYYEFEENLLIKNYSRGRSSVKIELYSEKDNLIYPMFISDFISMVPKVIIVLGVITRLDETPKWGFLKKGSNYGVYLVTD